MKLLFKALVCSVRSVIASCWSWFTFFSNYSCAAKQQDSWQNQTRYDLITNWIVEFCTTGWYLYATYCVPLSVSSLKNFPGSRFFLILRNLNALSVPWMSHSLAVVHCYYWRTKLELQSASKWLLGAVSVWARSSLVLFSSHQLCADRSENLRILYFILIFYIIFVSFPFFSLLVYIFSFMFLL